MSDSEGYRDWANRLGDFLDAVADRHPVPGGGAVAGAAGALACAMARMVAAYSGGKSADPESAMAVAQLAANLERADHLVRGLLREDARAYTALTEATRKLKEDPSSKGQHECALGVAIAVPMEIAAAACETLSLLERLLPIANRHLASDLGVATVLAEATVRAASYMVHVNAESLDDPVSRRRIEHDVDQMVAKGRDRLAHIESTLDNQSRAL